jgi:hypothetical protein
MARCQTLESALSVRLGIVAPVKMHENVPSTMLGLGGDCAMPPKVGFRIEPSNASEMIEGNATSVAEKKQKTQSRLVVVPGAGRLPAQRPS